MANKPVEIPIASETRAFSKGVADGVIEPLEDVQAALEDVAKEGDRAGDKLEDAMHDAQRATEDLKNENKELHDVIEKGSRNSFRKMASAAEDSYDKAGHAAEDMKDEGKSAFGEMAGSFDGSIDSMAGSAQGFLGGLAASGGPIALAAGAIALAAGSFYSSWQANTAASKQRVADMYDDMLEEQSGFLSEGYKLEQYWKILKDEDGAVLSLEKANEYAKKTGLSVQQIALAWAGNDDQMKIVVDTLNRKIDETKQKAEDAHGDIATQYGDEVAWLENIRDKTQARNDEIATTADAVAKGKSAWNAYGSEASKQLDEQHRKMGDAIDQAGTLKEAVKQIPTKLSIAAKITPDTTEIDNEIKRLENGVVQVGVEFRTRDGRKIR